MTESTMAVARVALDTATRVATEVVMTMTRTMTRTATTVLNTMTKIAAKVAMMSMVETIAWEGMAEVVINGTEVVTMVAAW